MEGPPQYPPPSHGWPPAGGWGSPTPGAGGGPGSPPAPPGAPGGYPPPGGAPSPPASGPASPYGPPSPYGVPTYQVPGPPKKKFPVVPVVIGAAVVVGAAAVLYFTVLKGDGATAGTDTPEGAVRTFIDAAIKGDCNRVFDLLSTDTKNKFKELEDASKGAGAGNINFRELICQAIRDEQAAARAGKVEGVTLKSRDGNRAVVTVSGRDQSGAPDSGDLDMVREAAGWRVDLSQQLS